MRPLVEEWRWWTLQAYLGITAALAGLWAPVSLATFEGKGRAPERGPGLMGNNRGKGGIRPWQRSRTW